MFLVRLFLINIFVIVMAGCTESADSDRDYRSEIASTIITSAEGDNSIYIPTIELPSSGDGETYEKITDNPFISTVGEGALSTFSIDVDTASYSKVRQHINMWQQLPNPDAVRIEEMINYFNYDYKNSDETIKIFSETGKAFWHSENLLLKTGLKAKELDTDSIPDSNLVFLIDTSGSMSDSLPLIQNSIKLLLENLTSKDSLSIITYAGSTEVLLPATRVTTENRKTVIDAIDSLTTWGGTYGESGINLAYSEANRNFIEDGNNRIILITDGDFNIGTSDTDELEDLIAEKRESGVFLTVLGMGWGNYRDDVAERLADKGNGNYFYIDSLLEAKKVLINQLNSTLYTVAKDVKIQVEFNPKFVKEYRLIGYENRLLANEDFTDDKKDAGEIGAGHTVTALYEIAPTDEILSSSLKYQESQLSESGNSDEVATIRVRYKEPNGNSSKEIEQTIEYSSDSENSNDFKLVSAVASFGMTLRDSPYRGETDYNRIIDIAKESKGEDIYGYRAEFIKLVENVDLITKVKDIQE